MAGIIFILLYDEKKPPQSARNEKAEYNKMLRELCPSKDIRRQAKRISKRNDSCDKCVYGECEYPWCAVPYTDGYMEDFDIDPCYEGVLRYLVRENS